MKLIQRNKKQKIVIIDSGIDTNHEIFKEANILGYECKGGKCNKLLFLTDDIGHGTAVFSQFYLSYPEAEYHVFKMFHDNYEPEIEDLIEVLSYIDKNVEDVELIHISSGCVRCNSQEEMRLRAICEKLVYKKKISIVAAYDNEGLVSYPAILNCVIGVGWSSGCANPYDFVFLKENEINILGTGAELRLAWKDNTYKYVSGSSFAAPYVSLTVLRLRKEGKILFNELLYGLQKKSCRQINLPKKEVKITECFPISKAIIFPINKETKSFLSFYQNEHFTLMGVYEQKYSGMVGKKVSYLVKESTIDMIVEDFCKIDWNTDFDTVILGHLGNLIRISKFDYWEYFADKCIKYNKSLFSFDKLPEDIINKLRENHINIFVPGMEDRFNLDTRMGKLYALDTPVVGIIGTSSQQGKFTLQMKVRKELGNRGYKLGHFSTEPTGALLGADITYPIGYNSTIHLTGSGSIMAVNYLMKKIEKEKEPDIIIIGTQSHSVPHNYRNVGHYPLSTLDILLGALPDICVLCINLNDEEEYVMRTINVIEAYLETKIIGLCIFPVIKEKKYSLRGVETSCIEEQNYIDIKREYAKKFKRNIYVLGNKSDEMQLCDNIIDFFC